jgi:2'-5' RNA ligase
MFVGLKMAPNIAIELARLAKSIEQPSVRLVSPQDIHSTLVPPWNVDAIPPIVDRLRGIAARFGAFDLTFDRICYGPQPPDCTQRSWRLSDGAMIAHSSRM